MSRFGRRLDFFVERFSFNIEKKNIPKNALCLYYIQGDIEEAFFSYKMNGKKSTALYSAAKERIPNVIISTCFKKHFHEIINERRQNEE